MDMAVKMAAQSTVPILKLTDASSFCSELDVCNTPPPHPPPPPPSSDSTTIRFQHTSLVPALPITAASLVVAAFLALLLAFFIVRLRRRRRRRPAAVPAPDGPGDDAVLDGGDGEEAVHHVWYIRTVGLDESSIQSITAWAYKAGEGVLGGSATDCTVCLSEFRDGELVRLLPRCNHAFHLSCIDKWLRSHVNCPLCRAPIVAPNAAINAGDPGTSTAFSSPSSSSWPLPESALDDTDPDSNSSAPADSNQMDGRQLETVGGTLEVQMECERLDLGGRNRTVVDPSQIPDLVVSVDIGEDAFQPIRRSVSMDSFISVLKLDEDRSVIPNRKNPAWEEEWKGRTRAKHYSISSFRKEVGRSLVSASGRFCLPVQGRARSSVLPV